VNLALAGTVLLLVLPAELPDKTLVATLVLSTRYRGRLVLLGVSAAFAVQCLVAVTAGQLLALLPHRLVLGVASALFAVGALILLRGEIGQHDDIDVELADETGGPAPTATSPAGATVTSRRAVITSFGVLFAAEWGDASQLLTAGLTARYHDPVSVFLGSFVALTAVAAIAVVGGRALLRVAPLRLVRALAATLFAVLAVVTAIAAVRA
jgi:Ca2+/H+ antiporter, TMEM165/GDT1 family